MTDDWVGAACPSPSAESSAAARARQASLTKPAGSLGVLEDIAVQLAGLQGRAKPTVERPAVVLFAGDHGVTAEGISAFPSSVTVEMLRNFARGGAAISVLSRALGATLQVVDAGALEHPPIEGVITDKPRAGTGNFAHEPAMTRDELERALAAGRRAVERSRMGGADLVILGEMGIGNTTAAAAIASALLARSAREIVGAGTGLDASGVARKAVVIEKALARHGLAHGSGSARDVLASVGGLEIAALSGAIVAAAQARLPVLVDGFIVSVAALAAVRINPGCRPWLLFSHRSAEQGHWIVLDALQAKPILDLSLRLGEGSGAAIAFPIVQLACRLHGEMATFEEAQVSQRSP